MGGPRLAIAVVVVLAAVTGVALWPSQGAGPGATTAEAAKLDPSAEAHRLVEAGALLLDVRTPAEFAAGHVAGAVNIPVQELRERLAELPAKEQPVVVYCRSGARSASATAMLREAGHTAIHDLGPMSAW